MVIITANIIAGNEIYMLFAPFINCKIYCCPQFY